LRFDDGNEVSVGSHDECRDCFPDKQLQLRSISVHHRPDSRIADGQLCSILPYYLRDRQQGFSGAERQAFLLVVAISALATEAAVVLNAPRRPRASARWSVDLDNPEPLQ
jgi:hypothetical protein